MPHVRLELTTFRLWDWRAAYCANKADRFCDFSRKSRFKIRKTLKTRKRCQITQISMEFSRTRSRYAKNAENAASANQPRRIVNFSVNSDFLVAQSLKPCPVWGSNSRPSDYETDALPTALMQHLRFKWPWNLNIKVNKILWNWFWFMSYFHPLRSSLSPSSRHFQQRVPHSSLTFQRQLGVRG